MWVVPACLVFTAAATVSFWFLHDHRLEAYGALPRLQVAANPNTPSETLGALARDRSDDVREGFVAAQHYLGKKAGI